MFKRGDVIRGTVSSNKDSYGLYDVSIGGPFPYRRIPTSRPRHQYFAGMQVLLGFLGTDCPVIISPGYSQSGWPLPVSGPAFLATVLRPQYNFGHSNFLLLPENFEPLLQGTGEQAWQYDEGETLGYSYGDPSGNAGYIFTNKNVYQVSSDGSAAVAESLDVSGQDGYSGLFGTGFSGGGHMFDQTQKIIRAPDYSMDYDDEEIIANTALDGSTPAREGYDYSSGLFLFQGSSGFHSDITRNSRSMLALNYTAGGDYAFTDIYRQVWGNREYLSTLYFPGWPAFSDLASADNISVINDDGDVVRLCHWITGDTIEHESYGLCYPVSIGYIDEEGALHTITSGVRPTVMSYPTPNIRSIRFLGNRPRYLVADFSGNYSIINTAIGNYPGDAVSYSSTMLDTHLTNGTIADNTHEYKVTALSGAIRIQRYTPLMAADGDPVDVDVSEYIANTFTIARPVIDSAGRIFTAYRDTVAKRRGVIGIADGEVIFHYQSPKTSNTNTYLEFRYFGSLIALVEEDSDVSPATYRAVMIRNSGS